MTSKQILITSTVLVLVSFSIGRYTVPEKVRIETKTVTVQKQVETTHENLKKNTLITEVVKPDGTKTTVTKINENNNSDKTDRSWEDTDSSTLSETTRGSAPLSLNFLVGKQLNSSIDPKYGVSLSKPILGPVSVGVWGFSDKTVGFSIGVNL